LSNYKGTKIKKVFKNLYGYRSLRVNVLLKSFPANFKKAKLTSKLVAPRLGPIFKSYYQPSKLIVTETMSQNRKLSFIFCAISLYNLTSSDNFFKKQYLLSSLTILYIFDKKLTFSYMPLIEKFFLCVLKSCDLKNDENSYLFYHQNLSFKRNTLEWDCNGFRSKLLNSQPLFLSSRLAIESYSTRVSSSTQASNSNVTIKFARSRCKSSLRTYFRAHIFSFWTRFLLKKFNLPFAQTSTNYQFFVNPPKNTNFLLPRYLLFNRLFFNELDFGDNGAKRYVAGAYFLKSKDVFESKITRIIRTQPNLEFSQFFNFKDFELFFYRKTNFNLLMSVSSSLFFNDSMLESSLTFETIKSTNFGFLRNFNKFDGDSYNCLYNSSLSLFLESSEQSLNKLSSIIRPLFPCYIVQTNFALTSKLTELPYLNNNFHAVTYEPRKPCLQLNLSFSNYFNSPVAFNFLFTHTLFFKKLIFIKTITTSEFNLKTLYQIFTTQIEKNFFYQEGTSLSRSNLLPHGSSIINIRKFFLKVFAYQKFTPQVTPWYFNTFVRFVEHCSGKKVLFKSQSNLLNALTFEEKAKCLSWAPKLKNFRKLLGPSLFLGESLQILYVSLKLKDPYFLSNWMTTMFQKISFWKYKVFLRYFKYILRYFFWSSFSQLGVIGIKMQLKGKISVAGNARTRTVLQRTGKTGHATFNNKVATTLSLVKTFTGVQGFKLWIFF